MYSSGFLFDCGIDLAKDSQMLTKYLLNLSATNLPSSMIAPLCLNLVIQWCAASGQSSTKQHGVK